MGIRESLARALMPAEKKEYKLGGSSSGSGGLRFISMELPPAWSYQQYLKAYGEIGWLYSCVNVIAQAVAKTPWHLYETGGEEREEILEHELLTLLESANPFQSRYQFMYLGTMYKLLVGEEFWQLNFAGSKPVEMWLAPPGGMSVIADAVKYISHYEYRAGGMDKPIPFTTDEIIHVKTPNPYNPYRGLSPAQALTVDLDSERFASKYQQKLFYNDATPGFVLEYPADQMPGADQRKELVMEWEERFQGVRNRGKTAFLWGAKANVLTMSNKDMDFEALRKFNRDAILGAYHVPRSILGITEDVNRANAEAAQYSFAAYCVLPELCELRESLNRELAVFFGDNLYLDFENPVPEDKAVNVLNAEKLYKASIITRNEARSLVDFEPTEDGGEEFFVQPSPSFGLNEGPPPPKMLKAATVSDPKAWDEDEAEAYWRGYVGRAESYEYRAIGNLHDMWDKQEMQALERFNANPAPSTALIDQKEAKAQYTEAIQSPMVDAMSVAIKAGKELVEPENPHKDIAPALPAAGLRWLKTRIGWAADEIGEESAARLSQILADGFERGDSIDQIRKVISAEFELFSRVRSARIARTEIMMASSQGTLEGYKESGLVTKAEFYTAIDERVCEDCNSFHQEQFTLDDAKPMIPLHPNCRCVFLPVIE